MTSPPSSSPGEAEQRSADTASENRESDNEKPTDNGDRNKSVDEREMASSGGSSSKSNNNEIKLSKSPRFMGYLTMFLASIINFHGVTSSRESFDVSVITSTEKQRMYGYTVALISSIASGFCVVCHLDNFTRLATIWRNHLFAPKSKFEMILDVSLLLWWFVATITQTT